MMVCDVRWMPGCFAVSGGEMVCLYGMPEGGRYVRVGDRVFDTGGLRRYRWCGAMTGRRLARVQGRGG